MRVGPQNPHTLVRTVPTTVPFFFTAEFLLRGVIKVLLSELGHDNAWRCELWRILDAAGESVGL